ncbi:CHASE2 domain-containing protein [Mesorhizobium sp. L-8-3]|uniref:CHASE2 domain-containing protein n=1 Tax=Mesorhizobium sp. L-8-3 TaxID=2744522 RepID=UPI0019256DA1|nr:adenylate/guanylate cyclase domain-containing protein [Mesorhizobium sp. L-8-3]BCH27456.1 adenylate/guanylate cyclase domain-containing protein [Mesorhizobium sp. L-8-3]
MSPRWTSSGVPKNAVSDPNDRRRGIVLIAFATLFVLLPLSLTVPWRLVEARAFDYLSTLSPPPRPADGPVVVAIDEPSFAELGLQWPWPRDLHGRLVSALREAGAKVIGVDVIFAEPSPRPGADAALAAALGPDVVLAGDLTSIETAQAAQMLRVEPLAAFTDRGARSGLASIVLDPDGTLRAVPRFPDSFGAVLLEMRREEATPLPHGALLQTFGPARSYPTVSYYQALAPAEFLPDGYFEGKTVIVGLSMQSAPTTEAGGADAFPTSQTLRTGRLMSGAEIHATVLDNLRAGLFIRTISPETLLSVAALAAALAGITVWRGTGWHTIAAVAGAIVVCAAGSFLLLRFGRVFVPPVTPALAFVAVAAGQGARDYAAERRMRRTITRAFSQYLSPVMVERLASDPSQLQLGGQKRTITVLFSDIRGFTTIAESMKDDPQRLTALINRLLNPLSAAILEAGGTIDKYIGDAIMAFWNAPLDDADHAAHAVGAALGMLKAVDRLNAELAAEAEAAGMTPIHLAIGVGLNTGDCVVGNMGSDIRFNYSVLGDPVNLAARLEGQTKSYGVPILLGEGTARGAAGDFSVIELDRVLVKGKTEAATVSTVVPEADDTARAEHRSFLDDLYAGRPAEAVARLDGLAQRLPALADYYAIMRARLQGK